VRHAAIVALAAGAAETAVIGAFHDALKGLPVTVLANDDAAEGISASIRLAVDHAHGRHILFTLCDQPLVTSDHLRQLMAQKGPIVATSYADTVGVPAMFAPELADELRALSADVGARAVINAHRDRVVAVRFEAAAVDIDTFADYTNLPR
jgi:molybdenum cofactor cytidylyltransferase